MSDENNLSLEERFEELKMFCQLAMLRTSGSDPETFKLCIERSYRVLKQNGASEKKLKDLERHLTLVATGVRPDNLLKSSLKMYNVMKDLTFDHIKKSRKKK